MFVSHVLASGSRPSSFYSFYLFGLGLEGIGLGLVRFIVSLKVPKESDPKKKILPSERA